MAVHHKSAQNPITFSVQAEEHDMGIAVISYPLKVEPNQKFEVEIAVICLSAGCDLTGKRIGVGKLPFQDMWGATLTWRAFNARYAKWEYHGKVLVTAPAESGSYTYYAFFPYQSRHKRAIARFGK